MRPESSPQAPVRPARASDVPELMRALGALLGELRGVPGTKAPEGAERTCHRVLTGETPGVILVARSEGQPLEGFVTLSLQEALRTGGPYALIQELWVAPEQRSSGTGAALLAACEQACRERGLARLEVGLPGTKFPAHERVRAFYARGGFVDVGPRLRKDVK